MKTALFLGSFAVVAVVAAGAFRDRVNRGAAMSPSPSSPHATVLKGKTDGGDPAVIELFLPDGSTCSASVIAPRFVLTAAHCVNAIHDVQSRPLRTLGQRVIEINRPDAWDTWEHDVAVLEVAKPTEIPPLPINFDARALAGIESIRVVGFGLSGTYNDDADVKRDGAARVFFSDAFVKTVPGTGGTCYGDSGGPALATIGGSEVVIGVTSYSEEEECEYGSAFVRTDRLRAFLAPFVADARDSREAETPDPIVDDERRDARNVDAQRIEVGDTFRVENGSQRITVSADGITVVQNGRTIRTGRGGLSIVSN